MPNYYADEFMGILVHEGVPVYMYNTDEAVTYIVHDSTNGAHIFTNYTACKNFIKGME